MHLASSGPDSQHIETAGAMTSINEYLTHDLILHLIAFQAIILLLILTNLAILRRPRRILPDHHPALVSLLIPARNEELNIGRCIGSLLAQDYPSFEIIVLDDQSSDTTPAILSNIASVNPRLRVLTGKPLPEGWTGKNWACYQLARHAKGDFLLFTDADTFFHPHALRCLVSTIVSLKADLLTGFPNQVMKSWRERLIIPFFSWAFFSFTPLHLAYRLKLPLLSSAVGQMLLFRRAAYETIGGHQSVRGHIAEDLSLVRRVKAAGMIWRITYLTDLISCQMYTGSRQAFSGFSKNFFAAFDFRLLPYLFVFTWLAVMFWHPLIILILNLLGLVQSADPAALAANICLSLLLWAIPYQRLGFGIWPALFYPVTLMIVEAIALNSLFQSLTGQLSWKGRRLPPPRWKWI